MKRTVAFENPKVNRQQHALGYELLDKINTNPASRIIALGWMDAGVRNVYGKKPVATPKLLCR